MSNPSASSWAAWRIPIIHSYQGFENVAKKFDLSYHSPHKFRHGNAVYSLKMAKDIQALKAVSQNLMHSNISITDGVYGILSDTDIKEQIATLGKRITINETSDIEELKIMTKQLLEKVGLYTPK